MPCDCSQGITAGMIVPASGQQKRCQPLVNKKLMKKWRNWTFLHYVRSSHCSFVPVLLEDSCHSPLSSDSEGSLQCGVNLAPKIRSGGSSNARKLRSAGLIPQQIRAELLSNVSALELRSAGFTPQKSEPSSQEMGSTSSSPTVSSLYLLGMAVQIGQ